MKVAEDNPKKLLRNFGIILDCEKERDYCVRISKMEPYKTSKAHSDYVPAAYFHRSLLSESSFIFWEFFFIYYFKITQV